MALPMFLIRFSFAEKKIIELKVIHMIAQEHNHLNQIEEFLTKNHSLIEVIKKEDQSIKNRIIMALEDISNTSVSDSVKGKAKDQINRINTVPNV